MRFRNAPSPASFAKDLAHLLPIFVKVLGEERDDLVTHDAINIAARETIDEEGVTDLVVLIEEEFNSIIQVGKNRS